MEITNHIERSMLVSDSPINILKEQSSIYGIEFTTDYTKSMTNMIKYKDLETQNSYLQAEIERLSIIIFRFKQSIFYKLYKIFNK